MQPNTPPELLRNGDHDIPLHHWLKLFVSWNYKSQADIRLRAPHHLVPEVRVYKCRSCNSFFHELVVFSVRAPDNFIRYYAIDRRPAAPNQGDLVQTVEPRPLYKRERSQDIVAQLVPIPCTASRGVSKAAPAVDSVRVLNEWPIADSSDAHYDLVQIIHFKALPLVHVVIAGASCGRIADYSVVVSHCYWFSNTIISLLTTSNDPGTPQGPDFTPPLDPLVPTQRETQPKIILKTKSMGKFGPVQIQGESNLLLRDARRVYNADLSRFYVGPFFP